jgi:hypothetical protein
MCIHEDAKTMYTGEMPGCSKGLSSRQIFAPEYCQVKELNASNWGKLLRRA